MSNPTEPNDSRQPDQVAPSSGLGAEPRRITARVHVDPATGTMWVLGYPSECVPASMQDGDGGWHNCDAMGCGSASMHVLAIVKLHDGEAAP
jgi:hypothetical protein